MRDVQGYHRSEITRILESPLKTMEWVSRLIKPFLTKKEIKNSVYSALESAYQYFNGSFEITSSPGKGTKAILKVPI